MEVCFISGPYSYGDTANIYEIEANVNRAAEIMEVLIKIGYIVYCPHTMYHRLRKVIPYNIILRHCIKLIKYGGITHLYMMKGWEKSSGACDEHAAAVEKGLVIKYEE